MGVAQVAWQRLSKAGRAGQIPQIELLQGLTVTAATNSHDAACQKPMNALNPMENKMNIRKQGVRFFFLAFKHKGFKQFLV